VWFHGVFLLHLAVPEPLFRVTSVFPGVPIFFVIRGFLVASSYERNSDLGRYSVARVLRIYTALWGCFGFTLLLLGLRGFLTPAFVGSGRFAGWVLAQRGVGKTTTRDLKGFGPGAVNASLWTISVELAFYVAVPLLYVVLRRVNRRQANVLVGATMLVSMFLYVTVVGHGADPKQTHEVTLKYVLSNTLPPYLWLFLVGTLAWRNLDRVWGLVAGKGLYWLGSYLVVATTMLRPSVAGRTGLVADVALLIRLTALAITVLALAFTATKVAHWVLRGNDVSYGIYLYHWVLLAFVVDSIKPPYRFATLGLVALLVLVMAIGSWFLIERPAKRMRPAAERLVLRLRPVSGTGSIGEGG
jgi:peptidoglycan/LPS O-acetylase OafA/YrhL